MFNVEGAQLEPKEYVTGLMKFRFKRFITSADDYEELGFNRPENYSSISMAEVQQMNPETDELEKINIKRRLVRVAFECITEKVRKLEETTGKYHMVDNPLFGKNMIARFFVENREFVSSRKEPYKFQYINRVGDTEWLECELPMSNLRDDFKVKTPVFKCPRGMAGLLDMLRKVTLINPNKPEANLLFFDPENVSDFFEEDFEGFDQVNESLSDNLEKGGFFVRILVGINGNYQDLFTGSMIDSYILSMNDTEKAKEKLINEARGEYGFKASFESSIPTIYNPAATNPAEMPKVQTEPVIENSTDLEEDEADDLPF